MIPKINSVWKHHSGNSYKVILIANDGNRNPFYPITVIYKGFNGLIWAKSLSNFLENMEKMG